jgi:hypothetical protein
VLRGPDRARHGSSSLSRVPRKSWRRIEGHNQLPKLILGVKFSDGFEVFGASAAPADERPWMNEGEPDPSGQKIPRVASQANASRTGSTDSGSPASLYAMLLWSLTARLSIPNEPSK